MRFEHFDFEILSNDGESQLFGPIYIRVINQDGNISEEKLKYKLQDFWKFGL